MVKEENSQTEVPSKPEPFTTIDDLMAQAEALTKGLRRLGESRHPLDIRRGVPVGEGVSELSEHDNSVTVKAGSRTYFFDIKDTRDGNHYLLITESQFKGEGEERERVTIAVFPETIGEFSQAVATMAEKVK